MKPPSFAPWRLCSACIGFLLVISLPAAPATRAAEAEKEPDVVRMRPFGVNVSPLGSVAVFFAFMTEDEGDGQAPINTVTVIDVPPGSPGEKANLRKWDELLELNGQPIRGLTLLEFAQRIRSERAKGDLRWTVIRGVARMSFHTYFNGRTEARAHAWEYAEPAKPATRSKAVAASDKVEHMAPFTVTETWSTAVDVTLLMAKERLFDELDDPIVEAKVVDVVGDAPNSRSSLERGDILTGLNGTPLNRLTLRQLATLVAEQKAKGTPLTWDVRRGLRFTQCRYDGKWVHPLPAIAVAKPAESNHATP